MNTSDIPSVGSKWLHKNGDKYKVIAIANIGVEGAFAHSELGDYVQVNGHASADRSDEYPMFVAVATMNLSVGIFFYPSGTDDPNIFTEEPWVIYEGPDGKIWGKLVEGFLRSRTQLKD
jgi:hypothetical protein